ncbi:MAG: hypothetical protein Q9M35_02155 [Rhodothermus sp.]|nr:hypothetical protein [Rhodothermus sp.]
MKPVNGSNDARLRIGQWLAAPNQELEARWNQLMAYLEALLGRRPADIEQVLFLIGIQERGRGYEPGLSREQKQELIMEGARYAFAAIGLYRRVSDHPIAWEPAFSPWPKLSREDQEKLLRIAILEYFKPLLP